MTRDMPGLRFVGGVIGEGARLMIRLQLTRGHAIRIDELLQMRRQLHGQRTYFLPAGAFLTGYKGGMEMYEITVSTYIILQSG